MSKLRKEKNCLNCGTTVEDTFCPHCGQKNTLAHQNAFHAIGEFIGDYFHADGKFFSSIIPLLFRPGRMTIEYNEGRRMKYIHPFRLYIFISIVFFFLYFSRSHEMTPVSREGNAAVADSVEAMMDSSGTRNGFRFTIPDSLPSTLKEYKDSVARLPEDQKPNFVKDFLTQRIVRGKEMGTKQFFEKWQRNFFHNIPTMIFLLLPLVALILKLLYIRRKKYYIDHLVFAVHIHSFVFLLMILATLIHMAGAHQQIIDVLVFFICLFYLFVAMRKVYMQGFFKTFLKYFSFLFLYLVAFCLIFLINLIYTTANT